jgi:hypothetical protein
MWQTTEVAGAAQERRFCLVRHSVGGGGGKGHACSCNTLYTITSSMLFTFTSSVLYTIGSTWLFSFNSTWWHRRRW